MAQFRMGSHWLEVQRGRCVRPRVCRSSRCCQLCHSIEDELHLFECPLYSEARTVLGVGLPHALSDSTIKASFNRFEGRDWTKLAAFLVRCRQLKADAVDNLDR